MSSPPEIPEDINRWSYKEIQSLLIKFFDFFDTIPNTRRYKALQKQVEADITYLEEELLRAC
jgi:hypothetical protein